MLNNRKIAVFDFETAGLDVGPGGKHDPIQIACCVIDPRTLEIIPGSKFCSDMNVKDVNNIDEGALKVNKFTRERIAAAPPQEVVWKSFVEHLDKFNTKPKNEYTAPMAAGKNIRSFDMKIVNKLSELYGTIDGKGRPYMFNSRVQLDIEDLLFMWFESSTELSSFGLDNVRDYFGMKKDNAHDALQDVLDTSEIIIRFMKYHRTIGKNGTRFKGAFAPEKV